MRSGPPHRILQRWIHSGNETLMVRFAERNRQGCRLKRSGELIYQSGKRQQVAGSFQNANHSCMRLDRSSFTNDSRRTACKLGIWHAGIVMPKDERIIRASAVLIESKIALGKCARADRRRRAKWRCDVVG